MAESSLNPQEIDRRQERRTNLQRVMNTIEAWMRRNPEATQTRPAEPSSSLTGQPTPREVALLRRYLASPLNAADVQVTIGEHLDSYKNIRGDELNKDDIDEALDEMTRLCAIDPIWMASDEDRRTRKAAQMIFYTLADWQGVKTDAEEEDKDIIPLLGPLVNALGVLNGSSRKHRGLTLSGEPRATP